MFEHISDLFNPRTELIYWSPLLFFLYAWTHVQPPPHLKHPTLNAKLALTPAAQRTQSPILEGLNPTGLICLLSLLAADWTNLNLKFIAQGDRPYWVSPLVREFPHTCESGYGMRYLN
jgi:hypothetical protein